MGGLQWNIHFRIGFQRLHRFSHEEFRFIFQTIILMLTSLR